jgi:protease-3
VSIAEQFETIRNSELITLTQLLKNLREELAPFSDDWRQQKLEFNSRSNLITAIEEVTIEDVTSILKEQSKTYKCVIQKPDIS